MFKKSNTINKGRTPWNKGIPRRKETIEKIRKIKNTLYATEEGKEIKRKISNSLKGKVHNGTFKKGHTTNVGRKHDAELRKNWSKSKIGDKNPMWKGDTVKYFSLHEWIRNHLPKQICCQICGKNNILEVSSTNHTYTRNLDEWEWLCRSCHRIKDKNKTNMNDGCGFK